MIFLGALIVLSLRTIGAEQTQFEFEVVHHFVPAEDGARPLAPLIQGSDGNFYGTTSGGGASGAGTVYQLEPGGQFTTLHSFVGKDGANPQAGLIEGSDGNFYGTTEEGGAAEAGTIFKLTPVGQLTTLHSFSTEDGASPRGTLIEASDGIFYGTTFRGGVSDSGTIFKIDPSGQLTTLHSFDGAGGAYPFASLIEVRGNFYGTTSQGGSADRGTVFVLDRSDQLTTFHHFSGEEGSSPFAGLIEGSDGNFYGTTKAGGASGSGEGSIFKLDRGGQLTTIHTFSGRDGTWPTAGLIEASDGVFYGTLFGDCCCDCKRGNGWVFKFDRGGQLTTLHTFSGEDGLYPYAGLIEANDGNFYGTTAGGGRASAGVIFRLKPSAAHPSLHPGDCNVDGKVDISDSLCLLGFLFLGSPGRLACGDGTLEDAGNRRVLDWNGDAATDLSDATALLNRLFLGGPPHVLGSECGTTSGCPEACKGP